MYMETQCSVAEPDENGGIVIHSSTQTLDGVQSAVARALGIPCHAVTASELFSNNNFESVFST